MRRSRAAASTLSRTPGRTSSTDTVTSFSFLKAAKHSQERHADSNLQTRIRRLELSDSKTRTQTDYHGLDFRANPNATT